MRAHHQGTSSGPSADPSRLEAAARLAGARPAPATRCRHLHLGCPGPDQVVALAIRFPRSHFAATLPDDAPEAIADARSFADAVGAPNARFLAAPELAEEAPWDYVVAPSALTVGGGAARAAALDAVERLLSADGVASLPFWTRSGLGWEAPIRRLLRAQLGAGHLDPARAAAFARWLGGAAPTDDPVHKGVLSAFAETAAEGGATLADPSTGWDVAELRAALADARVVYLGDTESYRDAAYAAPAALRSHLRGQEGGADVDDVVDVMVARRRREALVCRAGAHRAADPPEVAVRDLRIRARPEWADMAAPPPPSPPAVAEVWAALSAAPHAPTCTELAAAIGDVGDIGASVPAVVQAVLALLGAGAVEVVSVAEAGRPRRDGPPRLWPMAEVQALAGRSSLISRSHRWVTLTEAQRALATAIGGRPASREALVATMRAETLAGAVPLPVDDDAGAVAPDALADALTEALPAAVDEALERFGRWGLLA